jgi:hypothetical protein
MIFGSLTLFHLLPPLLFFLVHCHTFSSPPYSSLLFPSLLFSLLFFLFLQGRAAGSVQGIHDIRGLLRVEGDTTYERECCAAGIVLLYQRYGTMLPPIPLTSLNLLLPLLIPPSLLPALATVPLSFSSLSHRKRCRRTSTRSTGRVATH